MAPSTGEFARWISKGNLTAIAERLNIAMVDGR